MISEAHEWNKLDDEEFLYMLNAIDRKSKKLTIAGLLMFRQEKGWIIPEIKESFNPNRTTLILITKLQNPLINPAINQPINPLMNLNEKQRKIISILLQNKTIKIDEIANILELKSNTIKKNMKHYCYYI